MFHTMATLLQSPMTKVTLDSRSGVSRLDFPPAYYVKTFKGKGSRIKFCLGSSRYQRELRNLSYFKSLGLDTPQAVAYGFETRLGVLQRAVLVTAEVTDAIDLDKLISSGDLYRNGIPAARKILSLLAGAARAMHADGFYHKDLKPWNVLVGQADSRPQLFFFDCPSGHHPPYFLLRRGIVRDLAHLHNGLSAHVRRADLLYMFKQYRGCSKLTEEDKALARDAMSYYNTRRMTRKRRLRKARKNANAL